MTSHHVCPSSPEAELQNVIIPLIGDPRVAMQVKNRSLEKYIKVTMTLRNLKTENLIISETS